MKKLVLLLQKNETYFHLFAIVTLICLANIVIRDLNKNTYFCLFAVILMLLFSYSSGFNYVKDVKERRTILIFHYTSFFMVSFIFRELFFSISFLYYFGETHPEKDLLEINTQLTSYLSNLFFVTLILWATLVSVIHLVGKKHAEMEEASQKSPEGG